MASITDIRERILNDFETPGYSLGFLINLRVRHPCFGEGKIFEYDKSFVRIAIWFKKDTSVRIFVDEFLDRKSDWQVDLNQLEQVYIAFIAEVSRRKKEVSALKKKLRRLKSELANLDVLGIVSDV